MAGALGWPSGSIQIQRVAGGDTCESFLVSSSRHQAFVKITAAERVDLFRAEADGLDALAATETIQVPGVLAIGQCEESAAAWLALEALDLRTRSEAVDRILGLQLAELHHCSQDRYGWPRDNFLGKTPQLNEVCDNWAEFFAARRLQPQIDQLLASEQDPQLNALLSELLSLWQRLAMDHDPVPSLLHGDLWSGNAAALANGSPVIFDPAVHVGDRECDLAMADLFGGFGRSFFEAYQTSWPLQAGWRERREVYQLYHLLNHANLFGGAYVGTVKNRIQRLQVRC
jgi:fructosamine-3-kinase